MEAQITQVVELIGALSQQLEARADAAREHANASRRRVRDGGDARGARRPVRPSAPPGFVELAICCFGAALALGAGLAVAITRRLIDRVSALRSGTRRLGDGDLSARVFLDGQDEFS